MVYVVALACLAAALWLANGVRRIGAVSSGAPIKDRHGTAVLLIDLQTVFWTDGPYDAAAKSKATAAILDEVASAKAQGHPVIAVRQEWSIPSTKLIARLTLGGQAIAGTPGTEIAPPFDTLFDHEVVKRVQDAFETGALDMLLERLSVGQLRIAGLDLNYCVAKTALAARQRGYETVIVTEATLAAGVTDKTREKLAAAEVTLQ